MTEPRPAGSAPIPPAGKGRPTPKRSEKERRTGPVAPPPKTRREAARRMREQQAAGRTNRSGGRDEVRLLPRDQGPVRAAVRDVVDSRRNVGVLLLPLALLLVVANLFADERVLRLATSVWTAGLLAMLIDVVLLTLRVRKAVAAVPEPRGGTARHVGYAVLRSTVLRRLRTPAPRVSPGGQPLGG